MSRGIAMSKPVMTALATHGIRVIGHRWIHRPGRKGLIFNPHKARDRKAVFNPEGFVGDNASEWGALPGEGVNADYCMCTTRWLMRGADGRFLKEREQ